MKNKKLYPDLPADLAALDADALTALRQSFADVVAKVVTRDEATLEGLTAAEVIEQNAAAKAAVEVIDAQVAANAQAEAEFESELANLSEAFGIEATAETEPDPDDPAPEPDPDLDPEIAEVVAEAEAATAEAAEETPAADLVPVAASAVKAGKPRPPRAPEKHRPIVEEAAQGAVLVDNNGRELRSMRDLAEAVIAASTPTNGSDVRTPVARADFGAQFPANRRLGFGGEQPFDIWERIQETIAPRALLASGGLCAPVTPYYQLAMISTAARPVRDSLAGFNAVRGGLQFARPATISDVAGGVGIKTAAQDAAGGTTAAKNCLAVTCPAFSTVDLEMIYRCLQFGNLNQRAFPELIAQWLELAIAYHARVADAALLDYIDGASTSTIAGTGFGYGTSSRLISVLSEARAGIISRNRVDPNARMRALLPFWARDAFSVDISNSQFERWGVAPGDVEGLLGRYGIEVTWYLDTATGLGQQIGAQTGAGAGLNSFPNTIAAYVFPEGSFLFLDGGTLDLGIVRDSVLNSTNDFQIFAETFEAAAFVGVESLKIVITTCENGAVAAPTTAFTC